MTPLVHTIREMLDLPKAERSAYLAKIPLTRTYVFGCLEGWDIRHIRRVVTRHGGTYRMEYHYPGLAVIATFRTHRGLLACGRDLAEWMNKAIRESEPPDSPWLADMLYSPEDIGQPCDGPPALRFETISYLQWGSNEPNTGFHPIYGPKGD